MKLLIASNNKHKIEEITQILKGKFDKIVSLADENIECDPDETGATFLENALIKAYAVAKYAKDCAILADDTGLCVDALGGEPGVNSARYAGNHDNAANRKKLLEKLAGAANRSAHFESVVALLYPDGRLITASGRVNGHITLQEYGSGGFGYDSLFFCDELGKTFAEGTPEEKNSLSHRGRALANLLQQI